MDEEVKQPELTKPKFVNEPFDYRNIENVGRYRGVGQPGKVGHRFSNDLNAMPPSKKTERAPRDHKG